MKAYLARRMVLALVAVLGVSTLVFFLIHSVPGDPVDLLLGESAAGIDREVLRQSLGLDRPLGAQYFLFLTHLVRGDLGSSLVSGERVGALVVSRYPATILLAASAMLIAMGVAIPCGVFAAARAGGTTDTVTRGGAALGAAMPSFLIGPLLVMLFSVALGWLPVSGREGWLSWCLPALTLGLPMSALLVRMTRISVLQVLKEDFVRAARAKGVASRRILFWHALIPAAHPIVSIAGLELGALLAGAIVTEKIFAWPGLGSLMLQAIMSRDYPVVQGCLLAIGLTYIGVNLMTDLFYALIDPRVHWGEGPRRP